MLPAVACGTDDADGTAPGGVCTPGKQEACACPGGAQGAQACNAQGTAFGACECPDASAGTGGGAGANTGGSAGADTDGGAGANTGGAAGALTDGGGGGTPGATITEIANGTVAVGTNVTVPGVVAMSRKFLVARSSSQHTCTWGVFVSEAGIAETKAYSGILVMSVGLPPVVEDGGSTEYCPLLGSEPTGGGIPDDIQPGVLVNVVGVTTYAVVAACANEPNGSQTSMRQISNATVTPIGSTASIPTAHVIPTADHGKLASPLPAEQGFHDMWGGVKVRLENVAAVETSEGGIVNAYGEIALQGGPVVGTKVYYRGYAKEDDACHAAPVFGNAPVTFAWIEGFSYLSYCTWALQPNSKCTDMNPQSMDCDLGGAGDPTTSCLHP